MKKRSKELIDQKVRNMTNPVVISSISVSESVAIIIVCLEYALKSDKKRELLYCEQFSDNIVCGTKSIFHASFVIDLE